MDRPTGSMPSASWPRTARAGPPPQPPCPADTAGGTFTVTTATFTNSGTVVASSGTLALDELISNVGTVTVRASGSIKVTGALTLGSTATVNIALGGTAAGQFGTIAVRRSAGNDLPAPRLLG